MADALEKVKVRIRQLRQMTAANGASEGEVMNALAIVERLMREHGLDDAALDARAPTKITIPLGRRGLRPIDSLVTAIGVFAEVRGWLEKGGFAAAAVYFGDAPEVLIAEYVHELCYNGVKSAAVDFRRSAEYARRRLPKTRAAAQKAFVAGMIGRLAERLIAVKAAADRDRVKVKQARLTALLETQGFTFKKSKSGAAKITARYQQAAYAGLRAGETLPLNPGVGDRADLVAGYLPLSRRP